MKFSSIVLLSAFAVTRVFSHGVPTEIKGANGVTMPALSVIDGTPRDCATPSCGAEEDTSIIRDNELGTDRASALGRTKGGGPVDASNIISVFMGGIGANSAAAKRAFGFNSESDSGSGTKTPDGTVEAGVNATAGQGSTSGLPTCSDSGVITMTYHQVNQDGAGPLTADIDPSSVGTDVSAFQSAQVTQDVPGFGFGGLSGTTTTDFPVQVQMPEGMVCSGQVGNTKNICVARVRNSALAGPFGGSVAFTQSNAARKRAVEYNLAKRRFARSLRMSEKN